LAASQPVPRAAEGDGTSELAAGILSNLGRIDVIEVIADGFVEGAQGDRRVLRTFVRGGGVEIGHLAAPPRNDPPGSDQDEGGWLTAVISQSRCPLLLDLHRSCSRAAHRDSRA